MASTSTRVTRAHSTQRNIVTSYFKFDSSLLEILFAHQRVELCASGEYMRGRLFVGVGQTVTSAFAVPRARSSRELDVLVPKDLVTCVCSFVGA